MQVEFGDLFTDETKFQNFVTELRRFGLESFLEFGLKHGYVTPDLVDDYVAGFIDVMVSYEYYEDCQSIMDQYKEYCRKIFMS